MCKICPRTAEQERDLCIYHDNAHRNLTAAYERWRRAYGELSWISYLERLIGRPEIGTWVREVAELELKEKSEVPR